MDRGGFYRLASQNPADNTRWGLNRVDVPNSVSPGASVTFRFNVVAPAAVGTYDFQWRMVHDGVGRFGASTTDKTITVSGVANRPPVGYLDGVQTSTSVVIGWAYDPDVPSQSIGVHVDIDGAPAGDAVADQSRPDVDSAFGITGNHGFVWSLPAAYRSGTHTLHAYAVDTTSGARFEATASPITFTYPGATFSISGNAGVPGATVSAGTASATSDASGNYTIANLRAGTYALTASKSGCLFYPATQSATVGPSRTRVFFSTPCRLNYVRGDTPFADNYIRNFPYSARAPYPPAFSFQESFYSKNVDPYCRTSQLPPTLCAPILPLWTSSGTDSSGRPCSGLVSKTVSRTHIRPDISAPSRFAPSLTTAKYVAFAPNCYYDCDWCFPEGSSFAPCNPNRLCATLSVLSYLVVADPIGDNLSQAACRFDGKHYRALSNGLASKNVYVGEITPDFWGIVPMAPDLLSARQYQILVPPGRQLQADKSGIGTTLRSGDAYWDKFPTMIAPPPLMGGGQSPDCLDGYIECVSIASRARASLVEGPDGTLQWVITISGYMTADDPIRNTIDAEADLYSLAHLSKTPGAYVSVNLTVSAVIQFLTDHQAYTAVIQGHSLGAMDALVLYQMGYGGSVIVYAPPYVLPDQVFLETTSPAVDGRRPVLAYSGYWDSIANQAVLKTCGLTINACRIQLCSTTGRCSFYEVDTGKSFITGNNPHDRCIYQRLAYPGVPCW